ncbi:redoxin domain-containing protein [Paenibacillus sp. J22TS3]|uniref:TlpA family protein disulfide reductase n=1 Tax=Paenibacillus sp. J22TS3 TaxID=2807192 RepID=UPI001B27ECB9|nr:redoxin domain-containing protein [Paenibacillus sp. J22TS3]GIP20693.1 hypothetical protein J22TS3_09680 [Paenibacillus sp. J22TS3]
MNNAFMLSYTVLWGVVIVMSGIILQLMKRLTTVNQRMYHMIPKDLPLSHEGIEVGRPFYSLAVGNTEGHPVSWTDQQKKGSIVLFTSSFCSTCKTVYPILNELAGKYNNYHFILVIEGEAEYARHVREAHGLSLPVVPLPPEKFQELSLPGIPFSYLLDPQMNVMYKGITGTDVAFRMLIDKGSAAAEAGHRSNKKRKAS